MSRFRDEVVLDRLITQSVCNWTWNTPDVFGVSDDLITAFDVFEEQKYGEFRSYILCVNVNNMNSIKHDALKEMIESLKPVFVFVMEPWTNVKPPQRYYAYDINDIYGTSLWIRQDICRGRAIKQINYGKLMNFALDTSLADQKK